MKRSWLRSMHRIIEYDNSVVAGIIKSRPGEAKIGQEISFLPQIEENSSKQECALTSRLAMAKSKGARFVVLGIPEDIGPRGNLGRGGANAGYDSFLRHFLNFQSNQFIKSEEILLLGEVDCAHLMRSSQNASIEKLRNMCCELDEMVFEVVNPIFMTGLTPIIVGGGHNNSYPLIKAKSNALNRPINAINLDPHADFRALEGRHSGNGFSYAHNDGYLNLYHIIGLNELKNNQAILNALAEAKCTFDSYQSIYQRKSVTFDIAISAAIERVSSEDFGIELDVDCITGMPVSAYNECGITVDDAAHYVYKTASNSKSTYLHLCEAAPKHHYAGLAAGEEAVGQILASLAATFIQAKQQ